MSGVRAKVLAVVPSDDLVSCRVCHEQPKERGDFIDIEMGSPMTHVSRLCPTCASVLADLIMRTIK